jgi:hypothetical protein
MDKMQRANNQGASDKLRTREHLEPDGDNELQRQDRKIFSRALIYSVIAMVLIMLAAYLFVRWGKMPGNSVHPDKHPSSEWAQPAKQWLA